MLHWRNGHARPLQRPGCQGLTADQNAGIGATRNSRPRHGDDPWTDSYAAAKYGKPSG